MSDKSNGRICANRHLQRFVTENMCWADLTCKTPLQHSMYLGISTAVKWQIPQMAFDVGLFPAVAINMSTCEQGYIFLPSPITTIPAPPPKKKYRERCTYYNLFIGYQSLTRYVFLMLLPILFRCDPATFFFQKVYPWRTMSFFIFYNEKQT